MHRYNFKTKNLTLKKLGVSIFLYVIIYIVIYLLRSQGLIYLQWFQYVSYTLIDLGIMAGTFQWIVTGYKTDHYRIKVGVMLLVIETVVALVIIMVFYTFNNRESIVNKNGTIIVEEKPNFSFTNWTNYYEYQNMFVRKNIVRIHEEYGQSSRERISIDYYDENGNLIESVN